MKRITWFFAVILATFPGFAFGAEFDGSKLSPLWGLPFAGILLSIALMPLFAPFFGTITLAK
jgi:hypothetical protein